MSVNQWTIEEFATHQPVFRVSTLSRVLLGLAFLPFAVAGMYWVSTVAIEWLFGKPVPHMAISLFFGGLFAAIASIVAVEWLAAHHYSRLHRKYDVIGRCETLLRTVLKDEAFLREHYRHMRPTFILRLQRTAESSIGRLAVEERDEAEVLSLIDAWLESSENQNDG